MKEKVLGIEGDVVSCLWYARLNLYQQERLTGDKEKDSSSINYWSVL